MALSDGLFGLTKLIDVVSSSQSLLARSACRERDGLLLSLTRSNVYTSLHQLLIGLRSFCVHIGVQMMFFPRRKKKEV